jgi:hypothetical protein
VNLLDDLVSRGLDLPNRGCTFWTAAGSDCGCEEGRGGVGGDPALLGPQRRNVLDI